MVRQTAWCCLVATAASIQIAASVQIMIGGDTSATVISALCEHQIGVCICSESIPGSVKEGVASCYLRQWYEQQLHAKEEAGRWLDAQLKAASRQRIDA